MSEPDRLLIPTIHSNGTSRENLIEHYADAMAAMLVAIAAVQHAAPDGRDYYPQDAKEVQGIAFQRAVLQHVDRIKRLQSVMTELDAIAHAIALAIA